MNTKKKVRKVSKRVWRTWTVEKNERLKKLYPTMNWEDLEKAFPDHARGAIVQQACRLGLKRPQKLSETNETLMPPSKALPAKNPEDIPDEDLARYMIHGRSVKDLAKNFKITEEEAAGRMDIGFKGYDLFTGPTNLAGDQTYVAVPSCETPSKNLEKAWSWQQEPKGQPYGVITFPTSFNHKKIRIIPIDGIHYGSDDHDNERFDAIIEKIVHEPNTFCYLNGDIIAEARGGKKEERERRLIDLSVKFSEKMGRIANKILFAQRGCFEERALLHQGFDPLAHFCKLLDIPYFREPVYIDILWGKQIFTIWTMHGHSVAQLKGSKINALRRPAQIHEFTNFLIMGHIGDAIWNRVVKLCRNPIGGKLEEREEFHIILGNFTKYLGTKNARRGNIPPSNETVILHLYADGDTHIKTVHGGKS